MTARIESVSTTMSRAAASATSGAGVGGVSAPAGCVPGAGFPGAAAVAPGAVPVAGAAVLTGGGGGGFGTMYVCQSAATAKQRKMARKTRFSMKKRRLYPLRPVRPCSATDGRRHGIESRRRQGMAARDTAKGQPGATDEPVHPNRLHPVFGAGGFESARAAGERAQQKLISANQRRTDQNSDRSFQTLPLVPQSAKRMLKVSFEHCKRRIEQFASRDGDDIECPIARARRGRPGTPTKHLA